MLWSRHSSSMFPSRATLGMLMLLTFYCGEMFECDTAHTVSTVTVLEKRADNKPPSVLLYSSHMPTTHFPKTSSANSQFISEYCKHQLKLLFSSTLCCIINHCLFQSARLLPARDRQKPTGCFYHYNPHYSAAGNPNATVKRFPCTSPVSSSSSDLLMDHLRGTAGARLFNSTSHSRRDRYTSRSVNFFHFFANCHFIIVQFFI